ncbi:MAG TPA: winged helix-turn-helix transcriptional regulator [Pseudomonadaceae bacterium]|nr:winged helix-turn-helix transcriptional regulator [Pseudomonadaceae bacterium]
MTKVAVLDKQFSRTQTTQQNSIDNSVLESKIGFQLRMTDRMVNKEFAHDVGMTPVQFSVFSLVATNPDLSQVEIAEALGMDKASTMAVVHKLEVAGLIRCEIASHDKRMHALQLTPTGKRRFPQTNRKVIAHEDAFSNRLTKKEQEALFVYLAKIRA